MKEAYKENGTNKKKSNAKYWLFVARFFGVFVLLFIAAFIYHKVTKMIPSEHFDDQMITIQTKDMSKSSSLSFREFGYYILVMEKDVQETACAYDPKQPSSYWNLYIGSEDNKVGYVRNLAKEYAVSYAVRDLIYEEEAEKAGFQMDTQQREDAEMDGRDMLSDFFSEEKLAAVGMDEEAFLQMAVRVANGQAYITYLVDQGYSPEELEVGGSYYEKLLEQYQTEVNQSIYDEIIFGSITVNQ